MHRLLPLALLLTAACSGKDSDDSGAAGDATFARVNDEVLANGCALSTCHAAGSDGAVESGLTLSDSDASANYAAIVNATGASGKTLVVPNDPDGSFLVTKVTGAQESGEGDPMPPPFGLDAEKAALVVAWVEAGAENN